MIEFPAGIVPNAATPNFIDFGGIIRPATGAELLLVNRPGSRFRVDMTLAPDTAEERRIVIARLLAAKREGLRVEYPLQGVDQSVFGAAGTLVVNGAGQSGNSINLRGGVPGYVAKEGFWLSLVRSDGRHYLHNVRSPGATVTAGGLLALPISPNLRYPFADGAIVKIVTPMIEGLLDSSISWNLALGNLIDGIGFSIEEAG